MLTNADLRVVLALMERRRESLRCTGLLVAEGTPEELKAMVERDYGQTPTLGSVFMTFTGKSLDDDIDEESPSEDDE